jgi:phospholipase C
MSDSGITRRDVLRGAGAAGLGLGMLGGLDGLLTGAAEAAKPKLGTLKDIEHVVILMQENRSFDHYFGTLSGVRGFSDKHGAAAFTQVGTNGKKQGPFHLPQDCLPDLTHDWGPQHQSWNRGKMNKFLLTHERDDVPSVYGSPAGTGVETMGYYDRSDLGFYYALADAFTICDGYHCSVIGPTDPNRLMSMTATIDPAGKHGGPLIQTNVGGRTGKFTWATMPERLQAHGIDWKVYSGSGGAVLDNVLTYFLAYSSGSKLAARGLNPVYPNDFMSDLSSGNLPQVSWVLAPILDTEHPGFSGAVQGEIFARQLVETLMSNKKTWEKTALFITWDENGGFFDHVEPPTPPPGTTGEYLTSKPLPNDSFHGIADGISGPIGLGFRVPMLVVSPYTRGGLVCSDVFDHTSTLQFLETRFGVEVPNLTAWRRKTTGDLTSAFNFAAPPNFSKPSLPNPATPGVCPSPRVPAVPAAHGFPKQESGTRKRPSGIVEVKPKHKHKHAAVSY